MRRNLRMSVERKAVHTGTVGACQHGHLARAAKACAEAPDPLACPLPTGNALLHGSGHRAGEFGCVLSQGVIACRHHGVATRFEVPQMAARADDAMADLLKHVGHVGIAGRLTLEKAWFETLIRAIEKNPLKEKQVIVHIEIERTAKPLEKRHRPRLDLVSWDTACDRLVDIILPNRGTDDRMDPRSEVL